jgi:small-conductance mechanosensitive channel
MPEAQAGLLAGLLASDPLRDWLVALAVFLVVWGGLWLVKRGVLSRLKRLAAESKNNVDDLIVSIADAVSRPFYFVAALYAGSLPAPLPDLAARIIFYVFIVVAAVEAVRALTKVVDYLVCLYFDCFVEGDEDETTQTAEQAQQRAIAKAATSLGKIVLWVLATLVVLSNMGVDVTSLVAGVGIGGIAIALAVQNVLTDLFSSFSIYADKPFEVGDFIIIGSDMGTVEHIGLKSTRLRTLQGEQLVVSNKELTSVRIQNFRRMEKRRIVTTIGVEYGTPTAKLEKIPEMVKAAVEKHGEADFDRCHFAKYGPSSLDFEIVFFVNSPDYNLYMDIMQRINLAIYDAFAAEGLEFAFPTQTIHLAKGE